MASNRGTITLLHFGIAHRVEDGARPQLHEQLQGLAALRSPRATAPATPFDPRVDLWQLGVMGWEMLRGSMKRRSETRASAPAG